jgi:hypothetical protein
VTGPFFDLASPAVIGAVFAHQILFACGFQVTVYRFRDTIHKRQWILGRRRRAMQQTKHFRDPQQALVLKFAVRVVCFRMGLFCRGFYVTPEKLAEVVDRRPQVFNQAAVQEPVQDLGLVIGTGVLECAPVKLGGQGPEFLGDSRQVIASISHLLPLVLLDLKSLRPEKKLSRKHTAETERATAERVALDLGCS